jgi:dipeptidyl aminopeptidase/acylaminoacyl peptidase
MMFWVLCLGLVVTQPGPESRPSLDTVLDSLSQTRTFREAALSPDGKRVAWVESLPEKEGPTDKTAIYVADLASTSGPPQRISAGDGVAAYAEHDLAWSPDSSQLAFLSDKEKPGQRQIYVSAAGSPARRLTDLTGFLADPRWSPDGKLLAFLFIENAPRAAGPLEAVPAETGVIEEHVFEQRLTTLELSSGRVRQWSPADLYVYEYDWSGDGQHLAAVAAHGSGDNNWYIAELYTLSLASGEMKSILKPSMQIAVPRWSPDGKTIAFIGGLMSDEGVIGGELFTIAAGGGTPRKLTPQLKASASWLTWLPSGRILFTEHVDGSSGLASLDPADGRIASLWTGPESITAERGGFNVSLSRDEKTYALTRHSFHQPPEVWAGPLGAWHQVTHANALRPQWGEVKKLHWKSDSWNVQGWLVYPQHYHPDRRYPLVVSVHGGPASARRPTWPRPHFDFTVFSSQGFFVFFPNPRGSYGQGEAFTRANVKDFGYGDLRDILTGLDEVSRTNPVDPNRLGIGGWSYGGYMTMWAVTQTNRFRAAIAGAGLANWQSYYGQNGIDQWMIPYFGASVYDDPAVYARSSPITFIKQVKTPTLIVVGEGDVECPVPQSYEFWHALKTLGVPTQFVIYPHEGHAIRQPAHQRDIMRRSAAWFGRYLEESRKTQPTKTR